MIGGTGLVGPYAMQEIFAGFKKAEITTITRSGQAYFTETAIKCDRNDNTQLQSILEQAKPDFLIDMIPFTVDDAKTTSSLIKKLDFNLPVIAISSIDIYSAYARIHGTENVGYQSCPIKEDMALREKLGAEGAVYNKLEIEKIYQDALPNITILRLPATYGWPDKRRIDYYLDPMLAGDEVIKIPRIRSKWKFSRCLHKNAAFAVFKALEANQIGHHIYNVAEETAYSDLEWCQKIAKYAGWNGEIIISDEAEDMDLEQDFYVSTQKIRDEIGFTEKYCPDEGLAETIKLYSYEKQKKQYEQCY